MMPQSELVQCRKERKAVDKLFSGHLYCKVNGVQVKTGKCDARAVVTKSQTFSEDVKEGDFYSLADACKNIYPNEKLSNLQARWTRLLEWDPTLIFYLDGNGVEGLST